MVNAKKAVVLVPSPVVMLELTMEVAETLRIILQNIGGDPHRSRRGHADEIDKALSTTVNLVSTGGECFEHEHHQGPNTITFKNNL